MQALALERSAPRGDTYVRVNLESTSTRVRPTWAGSTAIDVAGGNTNDRRQKPR